MQWCMQPREYFLPFTQNIWYPHSIVVFGYFVALQLLVAELPKSFALHPSEIFCAYLNNLPLGICPFFVVIWASLSVLKQKNDRTYFDKPALDLSGFLLSKLKIPHFHPNIIFHLSEIMTAMLQVKQVKKRGPPRFDILRKSARLRYNIYATECHQQL